MKIGLAYQNWTGWKHGTGQLLFGYQHPQHFKVQWFWTMGFKWDILLLDLPGSLALLSHVEKKNAIPNRSQIMFYLIILGHQKRDFNAEFDPQAAPLVFLPQPTKNLGWIEERVGVVHTIIWLSLPFSLFVNRIHYHWLYYQALEELPLGSLKPSIFKT